MKKLYFFIRCLLGLGSVDDGSICWWGQKFKIDIHDYPVRKGGDGVPSHFYEYRCHKCNKNFTI